MSETVKAFEELRAKVAALESEVERQRALLIALQQRDPNTFYLVCQRPEFAWCREEAGDDPDIRT